MTGKWHFITIAHDLNYVIERTLSIISELSFLLCCNFCNRTEIGSFENTPKKLKIYLFYLRCQTGLTIICTIFAFAKCCIYKKGTKRAAQMTRHTAIKIQYVQMNTLHP